MLLELLRLVLIMTDGKLSLATCLFPHSWFKFAIQDCQCGAVMSPFGGPDSPSFCTNGVYHMGLGSYYEVFPQNLQGMSLKNMNYKLLVIFRRCTYFIFGFRPCFSEVSLFLLVTPST
jgi:hypothetical protein